MIGPTLLEFGTDEQKAEHLPKIVRGQIWWCQGYSEPNAGSDLASLKTSAVEHGDEYIINGSKIWTSGADHADWIFCLVRTDPESAEARRHHVHPVRHRPARRHRQTDPADQRHVAVLRNVLRQRDAR